MRILWVTLECIYPADTGGRIGVFRRLEQVAKKHDVYLFYPYDDPDGKEGLLPYCKKVFSFRRKKNLTVLFNCLRYPYTVASRKIRRMQRAIEQCIAEEKIDIINIDFPHMAINLLNIAKKYNIPIVLNEHNIEWQFYQAVADSSKSIVKRFLYRIDSRRLKRYEERIAQKIKFSAVTFVSTKDMEVYARWIGDSNKLYLVPVGAEEQPRLWKGGQQQVNIVFVGKMSAQPNEEAAVWFAEEVFPNIVSIYPNAKFYIVGKDPGERVLRLACANIVVTGTVDDVGEYYLKCACAVLPLLHGGGVKVKLLEAISYACPVVTTSVGAEGTEFRNSALLRIEDDAAAFADACVKQIEYATGACADGGAAADYNHALFLEKYTWNAIGDRYCALLQNVFSK